MVFSTHASSIDIDVLHERHLSLVAVDSLWTLLVRVEVRGNSPCLHLRFQGRRDNPILFLRQERIHESFLLGDGCLHLAAPGDVDPIVQNGLAHTRVVTLNGRSRQEVSFLLAVGFAHYMVDVES